MHIDDFFRIAVKKKASDIHLAAGQPPTLRINGILRHIPGSKVLTPAVIEELTFDMITEKQRKKFIESKELDVSYEISNLSRFRVNLHYQKGSVGMVARVIPTTIPTMKDILMPEIMYDLATNQGFIEKEMP